MRAVPDEPDLRLELLRARNGKWEKYLEVRSCRHRKLMIACQMCMFINIFLSRSLSLSVSFSALLASGGWGTEYGMSVHWDDLAFDQSLCWLLETCVHAIKHSKCQLYFGSKPARHATLPVWDAKNPSPRQRDKLLTAPCTPLPLSLSLSQLKLDFCEPIWRCVWPFSRSPFIEFPRSAKGLRRAV